RGEVLRMIFIEALALGACGSVAGVPLGYALARAMSQAFAMNLSGIYMMPIDVPTLRLDRASVLLGVCLGLTSAAIAAIVPARESVTIHPLEALRPSSRRADSAHRYARAAVAGMVLMVLVAIVWVSRGVLPLS